MFKIASCIIVAFLTFSAISCTKTTEEEYSPEMVDLERCFEHLQSVGVDMSHDQFFAIAGTAQATDEAILLAQNSRPDLDLSNAREGDNVVDLLDGNYWGLKKQVQSQQDIKTSLLLLPEILSWLGQGFYGHVYDFNNNGQVGLSDLMVFTNYMNQTEIEPEIDFNFLTVKQAYSSGIICESSRDLIIDGELIAEAPFDVTLSKTLQDEQGETTFCCFNSFYLRPHLGPTAPKYYYVRY